MPNEPDVGEVAAALQLSISLFLRRLRQTKAEDDELTMPESSVLSRLDRGGPSASADLARAEQISPQSMGATLAGLEARGLVERRPDPDDGRRAVISVTRTGNEMLRSRRTARGQQIARALGTGFTSRELHQLAAAAPLVERLAQQL
jgi:DNA-binding MarR family transcriptional regulator